MSIAIELGGDFSIETFDGLKTYVTDHLELDTESAAQVPTFIRKAEYRLNRLVMAPERETSVQLTTTSGSQYAELPTDYRQMRNARFQTDYGYTLEQVTLDELHDHWTNSSGKPRVYAISEQGLQIGPTPDAAYTIDATYLAKIPALSTANPTNWLLTSNADAYIYGTLWQACAWREDLDAAAAFRSEMMAIIDEINLQGNRYRRSSPTRLRSSVVV